MPQCQRGRVRIKRAGHVGQQAGLIAQRGLYRLVAATLPSTARWLRKALISRAPISLGWRMPWKRQYLRTQSQYVCSVRME